MSGRVVVVTAGAGAIGRAVARLFAERGDQLVLGDTARDKLEPIVGELRAAGGVAVGVECDIGSQPGVMRLFAAADTLGPVSVLVNGAGIARPGSILDQDVADFDVVMQVSARSHYLCAQQAAQRMVRHKLYGRIVNVSSVSSTQRIARHMVLYAMAKGAVDGLTRSLAYDLGPYGITVNAVAPGTVRTDQNELAFQDAARLAARVANVPVGRLATPEDIARAIVWLAEPDSAYVSGVILVIDGASGIPMHGDPPVEMVLPPHLPRRFENSKVW